MDKSSGVGVLDKAVVVLEAVAGAPAGLGELVARTGLARPTAHRLALALEAHGLLSRDDGGRFRHGPTLARWGRPAPQDLLRRAAAVLPQLRDVTGESAQLYLAGDGVRVCVAAAERASGLRDTVPPGTELPLTAGSAAQVFAAFGEGPPPPTFSPRRLATVRRQGWADSVGEREAGVGSVSAPVRDGDRLIAAVSISGPLERLGRAPGKRFADAVVAAAEALTPG